MLVTDERSRDVAFTLKPLSVSEIRQAVAFEAENAVNFSESELQSVRAKSQRYFNGETTVKHEPGRSSVVVTKTRDTIRQMLPSLTRIFMQSTAIVKFLPRTGQDGAMARAQTDTANSIFWNNSGYNTLIESMTNTLNKRVGIVKTVYEKETVAVHSSKQNLQRWEIDALEAEGHTVTEETEILDDEEDTLASNITNVRGIDRHEATGKVFNERNVDSGRTTDDPNSSDAIVSLIMEDEEASSDLVGDEYDEEYEDPEAFFDVVVTKHEERDVWKFDVIPPEEFIIDKYARSLEDAQLVGWRGNKRVSELVAMGFDYRDIIHLTFESEKFQEEKSARQGYTRDEEQEDDTSIDGSARLLLVNDIYMRIDADGDGFAELRHIITGGLAYKILLDEPINFIPLSRMRADFEPHAFFPQSINEQTWQDSDAQTSLLRSILDNAHLTNSPRTVANSSHVNIEDLQNSEIGSIIRVTDVNQIQELTTPNTAASTLPVLQYLEQVCEKRTGLVNAFQGSDPDALQSTSRQGVNAMIQGGQSMIEMIARNMAEGIEGIFRNIVRCIVEKKLKQIEIRGSDGIFRMVNSEQWHTSVDSEIDVGFGTNQPEEKMAFLGMVAQKQELVLEKYGPFSPYLKYEHLRYTYTEMMRLAGYKNVQNFFPIVNPQEEQKFMQQQEQKKQAEMGGDAQAKAFVQAEKYKADMKAKMDQMKTQAKIQIDLLKEQAKMGDSTAKQQIDVWSKLLDDDLARDEMSADTELRAAEIEGKYMIDVDKNKIQREQAQRDFRSGPSNGGSQVS